MKVMVVGGGGREHAICWKIAQSPLLTKLYCAPGNPGIEAVAECIAIQPDAVEQLASFAEERGMDLVVIGPELPLTLGLADELEARGMPVFGPTRAAARLEGSKVFAKEFMERHGIPTARFVVVSDADAAQSAALDFGLPVVLKADGLAAGKGVLIPENEDELAKALAILFEERRFGAASDQVVVEECLEGEEVSVIALSDGHGIVPFATSKDYKRIGEGDEGPNTGGMGAHSPAGIFSAEAEADAMDTVMRPTIDGMAEEGSPFRGVLYAGLMLTEAGPRVLEFNVRLGDPEAQALLPRLSADLLAVCVDGAATTGFQTDELPSAAPACACLVLASSGYPGEPVSGEEISGLEEASELPDVVIFHAGTRVSGDHVVTAGGRVLNVCATGSDLEDALDKAYDAADRISWPGKVVRRDIGRRVVERQGGS